MTREEMASFLARTAGIGGNPPVANAKTAQTAASATTAQSAVTAQTATNATHAASADTATSAGNATTVGGLAPNGLVRVARGVGANRVDLASPTPLPITQTLTGFPFPATLQPVVSVQVTAPAPGYVLVTGSVAVQTYGNTSTFAPLYGRLRHTATNSASPALACGSVSDNAICSLSPTFVFPVGAGSQTFTLEVAKSSSNLPAQAEDGVVTALYIPFGSTSGGTLETTQPASALSETP